MNHRYLRTMAAVVLCFAALLASQFLFGSVPNPRAVVVLAPLPSPGGPHSSEPQFTSQGDDVLLSWIETSGELATLKFAKRTATGWSSPRIVASGKDFFVNSADVPGVREMPNGTLVAEWLQRNGADEDSDAYSVRLSWSRDQGRTWSQPQSPHHDGTETQHGFVSLFPVLGGSLGLVWLDGRATNPKTGAGDMSLRASLYGANAKQFREMLVASRVCDCCSTSAAETSDGPIVAFRNRSRDEIRDIYVSRFTNGRWTAPVQVHNDGWRIEACPINGPAIAARGKAVAVAWFTGKDNHGRTFVSFSDDCGATFGPAIRVDDVSSNGRVGVQLLDDGSAAVTWIEFAQQQSSFRVRTVTPGGAVSAPAIISKSVSGFPRIASTKNELLFSWTQNDGDSLRIRTARAQTGSNSPLK